MTIENRTVTKRYTSLSKIHNVIGCLSISLNRMLDCAGTDHRCSHDCADDLIIGQFFYCSTQALLIVIVLRALLYGVMSTPTFWKFFFRENRHSSAKRQTLLRGFPASLASCSLQRIYLKYISELAYLEAYLQIWLQWDVVFAREILPKKMLCWTMGDTRLLRHW